MHKKLLKSLIITTVVVLLNGCVSSLAPKTVKNNEIPSWYINALSNTPKYLYGEGSGSTLKEAKSNALDTMASRLIVSVSSNTNVSTTSSSGDSFSYNKNINKKIKLDVQKIKFTNAKVIKNANIVDKFYILMKVNREELFNNNQKEFISNDQRIDKKYRQLLQYSKLERINLLKQMYPSIMENKERSIVLNAINNDFDQTPFLKKYDSYIDEISILKNNLTITVKTNNKYKYFADLLIDELNSNQYKISSNGDIVIKINNKVKYSIARGWNIAKVSTTLSVMSNNKIISNKTINSIGRSSTSKQSALESASNSFYKNVKKQTIDKILFSR